MSSKIFYNGKISCMDRQGTVVEAIYVEDGIIKYTGKLNDVENGAKVGSERINLNGKRVIPGLIDTHSHFTSAALSEAKTIQFVPETVQDILDYVKSKAQTVEKGEWIYLPNIYPTRIKDLRFPFLSELDQVSPDRPVFVDGFYAGVANTMALKRTDLYGSDLKGVIRDEKGNPTGRVLGMRKVFEKAIPVARYTPEETDEALRRLGREYSRNGITSVTEAMSTVSGMQGLGRAVAKGNAHVRAILTYVMNPDHPEGLETFKREAENHPCDYIKHIYGKNLIDGGILTGTSYMRKPYTGVKKLFGYDFDGYYGNLSTCFEDLYRSLEICEENGLKFCAHATGNKSADLFLDVLEEYKVEKGRLSDAHALLHGNFMDDNTIRRIGKLNAALLFQPAWYYKDSHAVVTFLDSETFDTFLPYKTLYQSGIMCAAGSDHMIKHDRDKAQNPYNPFSAIYNMVTGMNERGMCISDRHCVTVDQAVRFYTAKAAFNGGGHEDRGQLIAGKKADFACLSEDIFECPTEDIRYIRSDMTVLNGEILLDN